MPINKVEGRKNGLQKYRVRINYTDEFGKARQLERTAYGMDEARKIESQLLTKVHAGELTGECMTFRKLCDSYLKAKSDDVRETTIEKASKILELHVLPYFENTKLSKLSIPLLQEWKTEINKKNYALTTRKNIYSTFRVVLNYAVLMGYMQSNPLKKIGGFKDVSTVKKQIDYYTAEEFKRFISAALDSAKISNDFEWNYYVFFNIAFYTGARKGEIYALKWSDIDNNILHIRRSIAQKLKGGDRETPPKNKTSTRDIQLPKTLIEILKEHKRRYKEYPGFNDDWRICGGPSCIRDTSVANKNIKYSKLAEIKTIRIHDFRHSHASLLANEGINIQEIARRLGHAKIEMTWNTYSHLYPREEERAVKILDNIGL